MSLMRFLVVGSSLRGVKDRPSPYKMTQQHLLPKFGPGKEADGKATESVLTAIEEDSDGKDSEPTGAPGFQVARPEPEEPKMNLAAANPKAEATKEQGESALPTHDAQDSAPHVETLGAQQGSPAACQPDELPRPTVSQAGSRRGLIERLARYAFWRRARNPFGPKPAARKRATPVQGELLLEGVKVVRNDLNETDLEVIPTPKPSEKAVEPAERQANAEPAKLAWRRIAARLFGGRQT
jgi:hypothetical protein